MVQSGRYWGRLQMRLQLICRSRGINWLQFERYSAPSACYGTAGLIDRHVAPPADKFVAGWSCGCVLNILHCSLCSHTLCCAGKLMVSSDGFAALGINLTCRLCIAGKTPTYAESGNSSFLTVWLQIDTTCLSTWPALIPFLTNATGDREEPF